MNDKHPLGQLFYLFLITGGLSIFITKIYPLYPHTYLGSLHTYTIPLVVIATYSSFFMASYSNPGTITTKNIKIASELYDYDHILYDKKFCTTCLLHKYYLPNRRPARSKHCSTCKMCVSKMDHHCVWINNCVGYNNHKYFISFLTTTLIYCIYGCYVSVQTLRFIYERDGYTNLHILDHVTRAHIRASLSFQIKYLLQREALIAALGVFSGFATVILIVFNGYQFYLIANGVTTNESFKWDDLNNAILSDKVDRISKDVYQYNQEYIKGTSLDDYLATRNENPKVKKQPKSNKSDEHDADDFVMIKNPDQLRNIYDEGVVGNFKHVFFTRALE